jgi:hypothetical protein
MSDFFVVQAPPEPCVLSLEQWLLALAVCKHTPWAGAALARVVAGHAIRPRRFVVARALVLAPTPSHCPACTSSFSRLFLATFYRRLTAGKRRDRPSPALSPGTNLLVTAPKRRGRVGSDGEGGARDGWRWW